MRCFLEDKNWLKNSWWSDQTKNEMLFFLFCWWFNEDVLKKRFTITFKFFWGGTWGLRKCRGSSIFVFYLSNGHSPQICQNGELLVRMCRGESHFSQKRRMSNVSEFGEYHKWPHFGECESGESVTAFWQIWQIWWIFKLGRFMYKKKIFLGIKRSSLPSPNSP